MEKTAKETYWLVELDGLTFRFTKGGTEVISCALNDPLAIKEKSEEDARKWADTLERRSPWMKGRLKIVEHMTMQSAALHESVAQSQCGSRGDHGLRCTQPHGHSGACYDESKTVGVNMVGWTGGSTSVTSQPEPERGTPLPVREQSEFAATAEYDPTRLVLVPRHATPELLKPWKEGTVEYGQALVMWSMFIAAWDRHMEEPAIAGEKEE